MDFLWILKAVAIEIFFLIEFNSNLWYFASTGICGENTIPAKIPSDWNHEIKYQNYHKSVWLPLSLPGCVGQIRGQIRDVTHFEKVLDKLSIITVRFWYFDIVLSIFVSPLQSVTPLTKTVLIWYELLLSRLCVTPESWSNRLFDYRIAICWQSPMSSLKINCLCWWIY